MSGVVTEGARFVRTTGGIIGGDLGNKMERGAETFERKHQEINQRGR